MSSTVCGVSCIIMLNLHSHPMRWGLLSCPFQGEEWGSWGKVLPTVWRSWDLNSGIWPWGCIYFKLALPSWLHIEGPEIVFFFLHLPPRGWGGVLGALKQTNTEMGFSPTMDLFLSHCFFQQHPWAPALIPLLIFPLQGMLFLHRSPLGSHGNLKPSNCLVDGWMQVKLSGFGLWELKCGWICRTCNKETSDPSGNHWLSLQPWAVGRGVKGSLSHLYLLRVTYRGTSRWTFLWDWWLVILFT